jgi:hypothetical protein
MSARQEPFRVSWELQLADFCGFDILDVCCFERFYLQGRIFTNRVCSAVKSQPFTVLNHFCTRVYFYRFK